MAGRENTWKVPMKVLLITVTRGGTTAGRADTGVRRKKFTTLGVAPETAITTNTKNPRSIGTKAAGPTRSRGTTIPNTTGRSTSAPSTTMTGTKSTEAPSITRSTRSPEDPASTTIIE